MTNYSPQAGSEQAGYRPALVLTPARYNALVGLCHAAPITNQVKGYPFEIPLPAGCKTTGVVLLDQERCLSWPARGARFVEKAPAEVTAAAKDLLVALFDL